MAHVLRLISSEMIKARQIRISKINQLFWMDILNALPEDPSSSRQSKRFLGLGWSSGGGNGGGDEREIWKAQVKVGAEWRPQPEFGIFEDALRGLELVASRFESRASEFVGSGWSMSEQIQR